MRSKEARRDSVLRRSLVAGDMLAAASSLLMVWAVRNGRMHTAVLLAIPLYVVASKLLGLYDRDDLVLGKRTLDEAPSVLKLALGETLLVWLGERIFMRGGLTKPEVVLLLGALFCLTLAFRALARRLAFRTVGAERCLLIGDDSFIERLEAKFELGGPVNATLVAHIPPEPDGRGELKFPMSRREDLEDIVRHLAIDRVIIAPWSSGSATVLDGVTLAKAVGVKVSVLPRLFEVVGSSVEFDDVNGLTMLGVRKFGLTRSSRAIKRAMDLAGSAVVVLLSTPLVAAIAVAIKVDSGGPVFFRQERVGRNGRRFRIVKFRTMVDGAEKQKDSLRHVNEADGLFKIADDPRITRVGRFLRRSSLDELPQIFNVVFGDMSLVGPRPLVVEDDQRVEGWHRRRLALTPGITGHWQVLGSARVPLPEMVTIDYLYAANWSLWTDIKILLRTVPFMLARRGL